MVSLLGSPSDVLIRGLGADQKTSTVGELNGACKLLMIYFSMHDCPPCREFTPLLTELYTEINQSSVQFEVVFVSCDKTVE